MPNYLTDSTTVNISDWKFISDVCFTGVLRWQKDFVILYLLSSNDYQDQLQITWARRPYGFAVAPDEHGYNTVVSSISSKQLSEECGLRVGMAIQTINRKHVLGVSHDSVSHSVRCATFPLTIQFSDHHGTVCHFADEASSSYCTIKLSFSHFFVNI